MHGLHGGARNLHWRSGNDGVYRDCGRRCAIAAVTVGALLPTEAYAVKVSSTTNNWLSTSVAGGQTGAPFNIIATPGTLAASGTPYTGTVSVYTSTSTSPQVINVSLTVNAAVTIVITTNSPLPTGEVGVNYPQTLGVSGGTAPYTWSITSGALPLGLTLGSSTGAITGSPSAAGTSYFTVSVHDVNNVTGTKPFSLTIDSHVGISTTSLPNGDQGASLQPERGGYQWSDTVHLEREQRIAASRFEPERFDRRDNRHPERQRCFILQYHCNGYRRRHRYAGSQHHDQPDSDNQHHIAACRFG